MMTPLGPFSLASAFPASSTVSLRELVELDPRYVSSHVEERP